MHLLCCSTMLHSVAPLAVASTLLSFSLLGCSKRIWNQDEPSSGWKPSLQRGGTETRSLVEWWSSPEELHHEKKEIWRKFKKLFIFTQTGKRRKLKQIHPFTFSPYLLLTGCLKSQHGTPKISCYLIIIGSKYHAAWDRKNASCHISSLIRWF